MTCNRPYDSLPVSGPTTTVGLGPLREPGVGGPDRCIERVRKTATRGDPALEKWALPVVLVEVVRRV
jgi:hypothetical protein